RPSRARELIGPAALPATEPVYPPGDECAAADDPSGAGAPRGRPRRRRGGIRPPRGALSRRATGSLLPDARLGSRCGRRPPGRPAAGLARVVEVRGAELAS